MRKLDALGPSRTAGRKQDNRRIISAEIVSAFGKFGFRHEHRPQQRPAFLRWGHRTHDVFGKDRPGQCFSVEVELFEKLAAGQYRFDLGRLDHIRPILDRRGIGQVDRCFIQQRRRQIRQRPRNR